MRHLMRYIKSYLISYFAHQNLFTIVFKIYEISTQNSKLHYDDVTRSLMASQITSLTIVYSTIYSGVEQKKNQSFASLAFVRGIHRGPVNSPHKWPVTRKMFPFGDVIMERLDLKSGDLYSWLANCTKTVDSQAFYPIDQSFDTCESQQIEGWKLQIFCRRHFQTHILVRPDVNTNSNATEFCSWGFSWQ